MAKKKQTTQKSRLFLGIVALIGVVFVFGAIGLYASLVTKDNKVKIPLSPSPSVSPTVVQYDNNIDSWSSYTNTKYGFFLKYPSILEFSPDPGPESMYPLVEHFALTSPRKEVSEKGIRIDITVTSKKLSPLWFNCDPEKDCLSQDIERNTSLDSNNLKYSQRLILGKQRKSFLYTSTNPLYFLESESFAFLEKGHTWLIQITGNNYTIVELSPFIDQFLSTIQYTK